jgi:hypothetical protein
MVMPPSLRHEQKGCVHLVASIPSVPSLSQTREAQAGAMHSDCGWRTKNAGITRTKCGYYPYISSTCIRFGNVHYSPREAMEGSQMTLTTGTTVTTKGHLLITGSSIMLLAGAIGRVVETDDDFPVVQFDGLKEPIFVDQMNLAAA